MGLLIVMIHSCPYHSGVIPAEECMTYLTTGKNCPDCCRTEESDLMDGYIYLSSHWIA